MMRTALLALMGVSLVAQGAAAEDTTTFSLDNTVMMNVHKSVGKDIKAHVKAGAKFVHGKVMGADMDHEGLQKFLGDIATQKKKELPWWNVWSWPKSMSLVLEQSEYNQEQFDAITCKVTADWLNDQLKEAAASHNYWMFSRWNDTKSHEGVVTVSLGGHMPRECVEYVFEQGRTDATWFVGASPMMHDDAELMADMTKDNLYVKKTKLVMRKFPKDTQARDKLAQYVEQTPKGMRLMITDLPTEGDDAVFARRVMELVNTLKPGVLLFGMDTSVAPAPQPPKPDTDDETPSPSPVPPTPEEDSDKPQPEPIDPDTKPDDKKKDEEEEKPDVKPEPKPEPKPEDKKDEKKDEGAASWWDKVETVQIIAWILIVALVIGAGWWMTFGNKEAEVKKSEGLLANEAPSAATGVTATRGENKV